MILFRRFLYRVLPVILRAIADSIDDVLGGEFDEG